jgi:phosphoserine phosphatase
LPSPVTLPPVALADPALRLSTADLFARVHALAPKVAVFDCDGTLWSGDAGSTFMRWTMQTRLLAPDQISWLNRRYDAYNRGEVSELAICGEMVQVYRGIPLAELRRAAAEFFREFTEPNIFPEMRQLVAELRSAGCDIWAVSSTNDWVIEEGVRRFNIPANRVLAARVAIDANGLATDTLLDVPTDEGKVASLAAVGITPGVNAPHAVFGNSIHDAAMLAIASSPNSGPLENDGAFPINPSAGLLALSATRGWPVYFPASVAP